MRQLIKKSDLVALGASEKNAAAYVDHLNHAMELYSINTPLRISHFLAQVFHESGAMRYSEEIASGKAYEGRKDLGNTHPGDGVRYKGRGLIQLTGRANYRAMSDKLMHMLSTVPDFERSPQAASLPEWSALSAAAYWDSRNLNKLADKDDVLAITKAVNGGTNGLDDRKRYLKKAKELFL